MEGLVLASVGPGALALPAEFGAPGIEYGRTKELFSCLTLDMVLRKGKEAGGPLSNSQTKSNNLNIVETASTSSSKELIYN